MLEADDNVTPTFGGPTLQFGGTTPQGAPPQVTRSFNISWSGGTVLRLERKLSDKSALFLTTAGQAAVKPPINFPDSKPELVRDYVFTMIADILGMPTLQYSVVSNHWSKIAAGLLDGHALITKWEPMAGEWDGSPQALATITNPDDACRTVVFDTAFINPDRYSPTGYPEAGPNYPVPYNKFGNVLLLGPATNRNRLMPIDYGRAATHGFPLSKPILTPDILNSEQVFGLFPEFIPLMKTSVITTFASAIASITEDELDAILSRVPHDWDPSIAIRNELREFILQRAVKTPTFILDAIKTIALQQGALIP